MSETQENIVQSVFGLIENPTEYIANKRSITSGSPVLTYEFQGHELRIVNQKPLQYIASDAVKALYPTADAKSYNKYLDKIKSKYLHKKKILGKAGERILTVIDASGFYQFLARSNSPLAEPFQDWLFDEVLPQIQETGTYTQTAETREETVEPAPPPTTEAPKVDPKLIGTVLNSFFGDDEDDLSEKLDTIERAEKLIRRNSKTGKPTYMEQAAIRIATQKALRES